MTNGVISISPSSTTLTYVVIFQLHLHMVYIYRSLYKQVLVRGKLWAYKLVSQGFQLSRLQAAFRNFMVVITILFVHTTFLWATCCLLSFIPIVMPFLTHWSWLRRVWPVNRGCLLLLGTWSHLWYIQRSVYAHSLICMSYRLMRLITDRYFCHFIQSRLVEIILG
jgi:hypothetical protein